MRFLRTLLAIWLWIYRPLRRRVRVFLYFLILIAVVGNAGTLVTLGQHIWGNGTVTLLSVFRNFATYTIAIAATSFADCFLRRTDSDNRTSLLLYFGMMSLAIIAGVIVLCVSTDSTVKNAISISAGLAAMIWFCANAQHPNLLEPDAYSTLGGQDPMHPQ